MSKVYSLDFMNPGEADALSDEKVLPPLFSTVKNKQPIPSGSFYKRNALSDDEIVSSAAVNLETQLITAIDRHGAGDFTTAFAAVSDATTCTLYKYSGGWTTSGTTHSAEDGIYYATNALDSSNVNQLVIVKYSPNAEGCCYAIDKDYNELAFDAFNADIKTLNWRSAACAAFHQGKLWVGGLNEHDFSTFTDTGKNLNEGGPLSATDTVVTLETSHGVVADTLIKIEDEHMYVSSVSVNDLTVVRGVNGTTAATHADATDVYESAGVASQNRNRIRWSKTFLWDNAITSWTGAGTGYIDMPIIGEIPAVVGIQSFKNQLYVITNSDMYVISGETSAQYGRHNVMNTPYAIGPTVRSSERFMFWVDAAGLHQFNGADEINVSDRLKPEAFKALDVDQYDPDGSGKEGRMPTAFLNDKLGIYGVHFPATTACTGLKTWLFYYRRGTIETYDYTYPTNVEDITYLSDYHQSGKIWMGTGNTSSAKVYGGSYTFEPADVATDAEKDFDNSTGISAVIETGDINFAALEGGSYDDASQINRIDVYVVPDAAATVTLKLDATVDGSAQTQTTKNVTASATAQPTKVTMPLPTTRTGAFFKFTFTEEDDDGKLDIRRVDIYYQIMGRSIAR